MTDKEDTAIQPESVSHSPATGNQPNDGPNPDPGETASDSTIPQALRHVYLRFASAL